MSKINLKGLNEIAYAIAGKLDEADNEPVINELRFHIKAEVARLKKQYMDREGIHPNFVQQFRVELEPTKELDDYVRDNCDIEPAILDKCLVLRSKTNVPQGFRITGLRMPFHSVTTGRGRSLSYASKEDVRYLGDTKFGQPPIYYEYINSRLYVFNTTLLDAVYIKHPFDNPEELLQFEDCVNCNPEVDLGIPSDYVNVLIENVMNIYRGSANRTRDDINLSETKE